MLSSRAPSITVCIPHWQVREMMGICLESIRRHSAAYDLEVLVVDNGSRDGSLDWLRARDWIRLIERPEESAANWPTNVFTAWDRGVRAARGELFLTMHSDVFVRREGWLDPLLRDLDAGPQVAAAGAWKLEREHPLYAWQKRALGGAVARLKRLLGRGGRRAEGRRRFPRDYCALYRREPILRHDLTFCPAAGELTGGFAIARQLWERGYETRLISVAEMSRQIVHLAHGTAAVSGSKPLHHRSAQLKSERRARALLAEAWVQELRDVA